MIATAPTSTQIRTVFASQEELLRAIMAAKLPNSFVIVGPNTVRGVK